MRKIFIAFIALLLLLLIPLVSGCGNEGGTDASTPYDQNENTSNDSLDARVEELAAGDVAKGERVPGEVIVRLQDGITEEEAYQIYMAHGFDRESVEKQYSPQTYVLHFSEDERDIKSVIKELLLDNKILDASSNIIYTLLD